MKKLIFFLIALFAVVQLNAQVLLKTVNMAYGQTYVNITNTAANVVAKDSTRYIIINCSQDYPQQQDVVVNMTTLTGIPSVAITLQGRKFVTDSWTEVISVQTWTSTAVHLASTLPTRYRQYAIKFVGSSAAQTSWPSTCQFKVWFVGAPITATSFTDGTMTFNSGALTGATSGDFSTDVTVGGDLTVSGYGEVFKTVSTDTEGRAFYGKSTISGTFNAAGGPVIGAGVFGRINGTDPDLTANTAYLGGTFGYYGITGDISANTHPKGGVIGVIGDGTTSADAAVLALLDGDTGTTTATAAFGVRQTNSTSASGFSYGLDLYSAAIGSYLAVAYKTAQIRLSTGVLVISGAATTRQGILDSGEDAPVGSMYISTGTGGHVYVKVAHTNATTDWNVITTSAAD